MRTPIIFAAFALLASPGLAQQRTDADPGVASGAIDTSFGTPRQTDDNDFPWGLLGLLGLVGLLPRKKHDRIDERSGMR